MYKEYRDTTLNGAISQMYMEMSGRHRAPHESIQIIKTSVIPDGQEVLREQTRAYNKHNLKFPRVQPMKRAPTKRMRSVFKSTKPAMF